MTTTPRTPRTGVLGGPVGHTGFPGEFSGAPRDVAPSTPSRGPIRPGRRNLPRVLLGVGLVIGCALAFALFASAGDRGEQVLVLARAAQAGQRLAPADLTVANVALDNGNAGGIGLIAASQRDDVIGRTLTGPLPAGQLLSEANLGPAAWPPAGTGVVAVPVKGGRLPSGLVTGSTVRVVIPAASSTSGASVAEAATSAVGTQGKAPAGTVVQVTNGDDAAVTNGSAVGSGDGSVLSLLMPAADAQAVAAAGDGVVIVLTSDSSR